MASEDNWTGFFEKHPALAVADVDDASQDLAFDALKITAYDQPSAKRSVPPGRRQVMCTRDTEVIVAVDNEVRIASLVGARTTKGQNKLHKSLRTSAIHFKIQQVSLSPNGKLLAVCGEYDVGLIVLPRPGFNRSVANPVDCKSVLVGRYYHNVRSAPVAKIDWHPWGEAGSTLLVMTVDGTLREYDVSKDPDEPQTTLNFVPSRKGTSYLAEDAAQRHVTSFCLGKGNADWGPLTVYAVTRGGDVHAICPYLPRNALVPSSYLHALECFVAAKQNFISMESTSSDLTPIYDYQRKYVMALLKQIPPSAAFPTSPLSVHIHPPTTIKNSPLRQGPFLLQPSPRHVPGSEGGDATDIAYLAFGNQDAVETENDTERLGVVLLAYSDGKVDVSIDVDKVEARWESQQSAFSFNTQSLPVLAVYETVDLGLVSLLSKMDPPALDLLDGNYPVFLADPVNGDSCYVHHSFGAHALQLGSFMECLAQGLRDEQDSSLRAALKKSIGADVHPLLSTFSPERRAVNHVIGSTIPNDIYLTYSIFLLTSAMRMSAFNLSLCKTMTPPRVPENRDLSSSGSLYSGKSQPVYISLLGDKPFSPPTRSSGISPVPQLLFSPKSELTITPDNLRFFADTVDRLTAEIREIRLAHIEADRRAELQRQEFQRQQHKCREILQRVDQLREARDSKFRTRLTDVQRQQKELLAQSDRLLQILMDGASPGLSETEAKWLEELKSMRRNVIGNDRFDSDALSNRAASLEQGYARILPDLRDLNQQPHTTLPSNLGISQAFQLGKRSTEQSSRLRELEKLVLRLADKLGITMVSDRDQAEA